MTGQSRPRVLILTAGFGEGHNSAAKNLALALKARAEVKVSDPCAAATPRVNSFLQGFYRFVTTHTPQIWKQIYLSTEKQDFSNQRLPLMRGPENYLASEIEAFQPDAIVSTYPLYPYFCERVQRADQPIPVFTVITDSIEINAAWRKAPTTSFFVTDDFTRTGLIEQGIDPEKLVITGFPVHPSFASLSPVNDSAEISPFNVLYFPTVHRKKLSRILRAMLEASPKVRVTVVLGRNVRALYQNAKDIQSEFPDRLKIKGWTRKVPELLSNHHLVVGKAGGATVHEAIAARCPMFVHHLVPGQEEGNLELLRHIGAGRLTETEDAISTELKKILDNDAAEWRQMKRQLEPFSRPSSANSAASTILNHLQIT